MRQDLLNLVKEMPASSVKNYLFKNEGGITFKDVSAKWGVTQASNSNGSAYADLDNDGDLDLVINNVNEPASILQNNSKTPAGGYLDIKLKGSTKNTDGIGAAVTLFIGKTKQTLQQMPARGYQSTVTTILHFGLGKNKTVDSIRVRWPSDKVQVVIKPVCGRLLTLSEKDATLTKRDLKVQRAPFFSAIPSAIKCIPSTKSINDFKRQPLMVNPISQSGPRVAKVDVNKDGLDDVFIGGGSGIPSTLFIQHANGSFTQKTSPAFESSKQKGEVIPLFFDANKDGYPDLFCASGGYHDLLPNDELLSDELFFNDGKGNFIKTTGAIPALLTSKSCVKSADFNGDGSPDLFLGGRVVPGQYPKAPQSYLLVNDGKGHFRDVTKQYLPALSKAGMVTDAVWTDMNADGRPDLVIVGEWMAPAIFINMNGKFADKTSDYLPKQYTGWWNCILTGDFNKDGHPDFVFGNQGTNSQCRASFAEPAEMYFKDFDDNGAIDPILCFYINHQSYPYVTRDELLDQISMMRQRFPDYKSYAGATLTDIFPGAELQGAGYLKANTLKTTLFLSEKNGKLKEGKLPAEVQFSPIFTITMLDFDQDGITDLLFCGNTNSARLRFGKTDANFGLLLKGGKNGAFSTVNQKDSGFSIRGDVRSVTTLGDKLIIGINQQPIQAYKLNKR
jgi:hypothetical protein